MVNVTSSPTTFSPTIAPTAFMYVSDSEIVSTVQVYCSLSVIIFLLFGLFRWFSPRICTPRHPERPPPVGGQSGAALFAHRFCTWPITIYRMSKAELIDAVGVDIYVGLRLIRMGGHISACMSLYSLVVLCPIYRLYDQRSELCKAACNANPTSAFEASTDARGCICNDFDKYTIGNLSVLRFRIKLTPTEHEGSMGMIATIVGAYLLAAITLWHLSTEYTHFADTRHEYWSSRPAEAYTILVDRVPPRLMKSRAALRTFMAGLFPGEIHALHPVTSLEELDAAGVRRERALRLYEHALVKAKRRVEAGRDAPPRHWVRRTGTLRHERVESVAHFASDLKEANAELASLQQTALQDERNRNAVLGEDAFGCLGTVDGALPLENSGARASSRLLPLNDGDLPRTRRHQVARVARAPQHHGAVFVTFRTLSAAATALQTHISPQPYTMTTKPAPEPRDVRWQAVGRRFTSKLWRTALAWSVTSTIFVSWGGIVYLLAGLTNVTSLRRHYPKFDEYLRDNPLNESLMRQISPLIIVGLMALVWPVLNALANTQRTISRSEVDRLVFVRYFIFIVLQVFFLGSIANTMFKSLSSMIESPSEYLKVLRVAIPRNATFFVKYILTSIFTTSATTLYRVSYFLYHALRRSCYEGGSSITPREKTQDYCGCTVITYPSGSSASYRNASVLLILFITMCYALIQPFILLPAVVYFTCVWWATTHMCVYATEVEYDSGGLVFFPAFRIVVSGLLTSQVLLALYFVVGGRTYGAFSIPIWALLVITVSFAMLIESHFRPITESCPLATARQIDGEDDETATAPPRVLPAKIYRYDYLSTQPGEGDIAAEEQKEELEATESPVLGEVRSARPGMDLNTGRMAFGAAEAFVVGQTGQARQSNIPQSPPGSASRCATAPALTPRIEETSPPASPATGGSRSSIAGVARADEVELALQGASSRNIGAGASEADDEAAQVSIDRA